MAAHLLELQGVTHQYGSGSRRFTAIEDINLTMGEGEFVALLGPSGCGKSTLLRIITGLIRPTHGQMLYHGAPLTGVNPRATMVFQTFALFPWLTVQQNVETALKARGIPPEQRAAQAVDLLDMVGLDGFETAFPRELSGGMRQKVGFARALAVEPELLCLDEAFSALDVLSADSLRGELLELWIDNRIPTKAILMVTHNIEEAILMADRVIVMDKQPGRVIADQPVSLERPRARKSPQFLNVLDQVYATLAGQTQPEHIELGVAPGEAGRTRALPGVSPSELAGFLEFLDEMPNDRIDVYRLEQELNLGTGQVLLLTEAAELLSFATIASGDIALTPLGETFAAAGILARKEIFATRIRRMPMFKWLLAMLSAAERGQLDRDVVRLALELEFSPDEASQQVDRAIQWGRYAELLAYDDNTETIYQESAVPVAG
ncbi:MAG: AAA-associated domain-containing protein [Anaerolineae bacterium]|nr:AAA-associated domain-containing protein [Anaerolineae bacterium]